MSAVPAQLADVWHAETCNQPLTSTDARINVTNYTYSATTGSRPR